jgi:hypothetical protein
MSWFIDGFGHKIPEPKGLSLEEHMKLVGDLSFWDGVGNGEISITDSDGKTIIAPEIPEINEDDKERVSVYPYNTFYIYWDNPTATQPAGYGSEGVYESAIDAMIEEYMRIWELRDSASLGLPTWYVNFVIKYFKWML